MRDTRDAYTMVVNRIKNACAQDVTITSDDWEDWEMDYPGRNKKEGEAWDVTIEADGGLMYSQRVTAGSRSLGETYEITGSFNDWGYEPLTPDANIGGLFAA